MRQRGACPPITSRPEFYLSRCVKNHLVDGLFSGRYESVVSKLVK